VNSPNPAIVTQAAVRRLPRWAVWVFCFAYVIPGFVGRAPWKEHDIASFGVMHAMAIGASDWWQPSLGPFSTESVGWLAYWLGAAAIQALPWLDPVVASRIPFAALLGLTLACTWYTTYHLARLPAAQPVAFAFGGEAKPVDYARALADASLLALVACLGLAQLSHEVTPDVVRLACWSVLMLAVARQVTEPDGARLNTLLFMAGFAGLLLSGHGKATIPLALGWIAVSLQAARTHPWRWTTAGLWLVSAVALAVLAWSIGALPTKTVHWPSNADDWQRWLQLQLWFSWPAWPLALWTLWRWRRQLGSAHVALPLWGFAMGLWGSLVLDDKDRALLPVLSSVAVLAAFALPTLRRSASALIDWFALLFFSACAIVIWIVWLAMHTGIPAKPAANVAKLAPGFEAEFGALSFVLALLASIAWMALVAWRTGAHKPALWKSLVLPAAGTTLCWLLLMTLWMPLLDFARSYAPMAQQLAKLLPAPTCVYSVDLTQSQIAALRYHARLDIQPLLRRSTSCRHALVSSQGDIGSQLTLTDWAFKARVYRLGERRESLLLFQRLTP
jgi:hypothetical protein